MKKKWMWLVLIFVVGIVLIEISFSLLYSKPNINIDYVHQKPCQELARLGCEKTSTDSVIVENFDANKDGIIDSKDTLFELCKNWYEATNDADCKKLCGCS